MFFSFFAHETMKMGIIFSQQINLVLDWYKYPWPSDGIHEFNLLMFI